LVKSAYFQLVEVIESRALFSFIDNDRAPRRAYKELHHFRIFLDETGCYELFAESASARTVIDALSLDDTVRWANLQHAYGSASDVPARLATTHGAPRIQRQG
jgi:hypothetical protein